MLSRNIFFILFLFLLSCQQKEVDRVQVARVLNEYLYLDELPSSPHFVDSVMFVQDFINQWATKKLLINKAEFNLENNPLFIDSLVTVYRNSLLIHYYKQILIQNRLDTIISDSLIIDYYNNNIGNFNLKEDLVKIQYVKVKKIAPNIDFLAKNYYSTNEDDILKVEEYCLQFAERFFLTDVNWISWSDFSKDLPTLSYQKQKNLFLKKNREFELEDSTYKYFLFIQDFKLKGTASPLEYVSSLIKQVLINKQKKQIINNIEYDLIQDAIINNNFEVYE